MAVITPDTSKTENIGSLRLVIADFTTSFDDGDTWDSGLEKIVGYWANGTDAATDHHNAGIDLTLSSHTFTLNTGENARTATLYILVQG
jgi:hypothetical protein